MSDTQERKRSRKSRWDSAPSPPAPPAAPVAPVAPVAALPMPPPPAAQSGFGAPPSLPSPPQINSNNHSSASATDLQSILGKLGAKASAGATPSASAIKQERIRTAKVFAPMLPPGSSEHVTNRIYVGSIPFDVTQDKIQALFSTFGHVIKIDWSTSTTNAAEGWSKGYCFVWYADAASAVAALDGLKDLELEGRPIKVSRPDNVAALATTGAGAASSSSSSSSAIGGGGGNSGAKPRAGQVWSAAEALAAAMGSTSTTATATATTETKAAKAAGRAAAKAAAAATVAAATADTALESYTALGNHYLLARNVPHFFTEVDLRAVLAPLGLSALCRVPAALAGEASLSAAVVAGPVQVQARPYWQAQLLFKSRAAAHTALYTMGNNIRLFNFYLAELYVAAVVDASTVAGAGGAGDGEDGSDGMMSADDSATSATPEALAAAAAAAESFSMSFEALAIPLVMTAQEAAAQAKRQALQAKEAEATLQRLAHESKRCTVVAHHMVTAEDMEDPELHSDIAEESGAFGELVHCSIVAAGATGEGPVVYLQYAEEAQAQVAFTAVHGKFFGEGPVAVEAELAPNSAFVHAQQAPAAGATSTAAAMDVD